MIEWLVMAENGACMHGDHGASYLYSTREGRKTRRLSTQDLDLHSDMNVYYKTRGWMHVDVVVGEAACLVLLVNVFANHRRWWPNACGQPLQESCAHTIRFREKEI
ncbi:hypothetical protein V6N13_072049 [Hibiscus sabdariffa]